MADANYLEYGVYGKPTEREKKIKERNDLAKQYAEEKKAAELKAKEDALKKERQDRYDQNVAKRDMQGKADGGIVDKLEEMYDLRETYPTQFDNAVNSFTGEMSKIWNFWKDTLGLRRGGHVGFRR